MTDNRSALLVMDLQNDILSSLDDAARDTLLDNTQRLLRHARRQGMPVIYVAVRFRKGYPEVSASNKMFSGITQADVLIEGTPGADIHADVAPQPGEPIVVKRRVGAGSTTDLQAVLNGQNAGHLILTGVATSGVVLSTVRWAADLDYRITVVEDACADKDEEVHRVLTGKVFPRQADVTITDELLSEGG